MISPTTEKAAPIPAEVLALIERLRRMGQDTHRGWGPAYIERAGADMLRAADLLADRASQEERIREDEREALARHMASEHAQHETGYDWELTDRIWQEGWRKAADRALAAMDRARLRGGAS